MPSFPELWREVCLQPNLAILAERILPMIAGADALAIRHLEPAAGRLVTLAESSTARGAPPAGRARATSLTPTEVARVVAWARARAVHSGETRRDELLALLAGDSSTSVIAVPLRDDDSDETGVLVLSGDRLTARGDAFELGRSLLEPLSFALAHTRHQQELARLREALEADKRALLTRLDRADIAETLIGASEGLRDVMTRIDQVAPTDVPVLILGETGAGKEVIARAVHERSRRARGPIVRVNCGAIPPGLVDAQLFGHERGSFTGATEQRAGWFERADGGTLFLDEIGDLPLEAQVRLLRILQEGILERVGGHEPIRVDVRVVAATHRDLQQMVTDRTFRKDLWYRLSVFTVPLPPLRDRTADIPALAAHFARRAGRRLGSGELVLGPGDVELLLAYDWPGNVRELATVIERAAILGNGRHLDLPNALGAHPLRATTQASLPPPGRKLDDVVRSHIEATLEFTRGRIEGKDGAADLLGINPHTLRFRMKKLGIEWNRFRGGRRA